MGLQKTNIKQTSPDDEASGTCENALGHASNVGGKVLDLFGGSGTTMIASEKSNRNCYMMELDPIYADVIVQRWQDFTGKEATHAESGKTYAQLKA